MYREYREEPEIQSPLRCPGRNPPAKSTPNFLVRFLWPSSGFALNFRKGESCVQEQNVCTQESTFWAS